MGSLLESVWGTALDMLDEQIADSTTPEGIGCPSDLRARAGRRPIGLAPQHLAEGGDRDLDLVARRRPRGDLLEPQARRHQRPHERGSIESGTQPEHLEGE